MSASSRDRRRANDLTCMTAMGDVMAVLERHRVDRESDEVAFDAVVATMRTLVATLVDVEPAMRAELTELVAALGRDASTVAAWTRFEDFVEHWFVLVRHVVFGMRADAIPVELARLRAELPLVVRASADGAPAPTAAPRATVLLIDDSSVIRAVVDEALTAAGYRVCTAASFADTEAVLGRASPDVVLTDVCLPDIEGDDLCARLKMRTGRLVPVVLMSNLPELELSHRAAAARADAFVSKRHGPTHIVDVVTALLDELVL